LPNKGKNKESNKQKKTKERELKREQAYLPPKEEQSTTTQSEKSNLAASIQNIKNLTNKKRKIDDRHETESDYLIPNKKSKSNINNSL